MQPADSDHLWTVDADPRLFYGMVSMLLGVWIITIVYDVIKQNGGFYYDSDL